MRHRCRRRSHDSGLRLNLMKALIAIMYGASLAMLLSAAVVLDGPDLLLEGLAVTVVYAGLSLLTAKTSIADGVKIWVIPIQIGSFFISLGCLPLVAILPFSWVLLAMMVILILNISMTSAVAYVAKRVK